MQILKIMLAAIVLAGFIAVAQTSGGAHPAAGFSIDTIDKTIDPCTDFYQYACGNWLKNTEIPADQTEWVSFAELYERNLVTLREHPGEGVGGGADARARSSRRSATITAPAWTRKRRTPRGWIHSSRNWTGSRRAKDKQR